MTNVNTQQLYQFISSKIGTKMTANEAARLDVRNEYNEICIDQDTDEIEIEDLLDNKDLYAQFATLYVEDKERTQEAKDKDKEKEEQEKVQDKNEAGI